MRVKFDAKKGSSGDPRFAINKAGGLNTRTELLLQSSRYAITTADCKIYHFHDDQIFTITDTAVVLVQPVNCYQVPGSHDNIFRSEDTRQRICLKGRYPHTTLHGVICIFTI